MSDLPLLSFNDGEIGVHFGLGINFYAWDHGDPNNLAHIGYLTFENIGAVLEVDFNDWILNITMISIDIKEYHFKSDVGCSSAEWFVNLIIGWITSLALKPVNLVLQYFSNVIIKVLPDIVKDNVFPGHVLVYGEKHVLYINANATIKHEPLPVETQYVGIVNPFIIFVILTFMVLAIGITVWCLRNVTVDIDNFRAEFQEYKRK